MYVLSDGLTRCPGYFPASHPVHSGIGIRLLLPETLAKVGQERTNKSENVNHTFNHGKLVPLDCSKLRALPTDLLLECYVSDNKLQIWGSLVCQAFSLLNCPKTPFSFSFSSSDTLPFTWTFSNSKRCTCALRH